MTSRSTVKILAVDLDGTLVRSDGSISADDLAALRRARRSGFEIVVATARFPLQCVDIAREIGASLPMICVDGGLTVTPGEPPELLHARTLDHTEAVIALCDRRGLKPFLFGHEVVRYRTRDRSLLPYVRGWSDGAEHRSDLGGGGVVLALGLGSETQIDGALESARGLGLDDVLVDAFRLAPSPLWAARFRHPHANKGHALERLARERAIERERVFAVGNDWNDVPLFASAGRSFAMADAPAPVRARASEVLRAGGDVGGGIAEVMARLAAAG